MRVLIISVLLCVFVIYVPVTAAYEYRWENTEELGGADQVTAIEPLQVMFLDEPMEVPTHSASLRLMQQYSVYLGTEWSSDNAYRLLQTFESVPQSINDLYKTEPNVPHTLWKLPTNYINGDIEIDTSQEQTIVTISEHAFTYAEPRLAKLEGEVGRFFSKRLHHAVVRYVTNDGNKREAIERILNERYEVSLNVPIGVNLRKKCWHILLWEGFVTPI